LIVEGYSLDLYCDGEHQDWNRPYDNFGGLTKRSAWKAARERGWKKINDEEVICPLCVKKYKVLGVLDIHYLLRKIRERRERTRKNLT